VNDLLHHSLQFILGSVPEYFRDHALMWGWIGAVISLLSGGLSQLEQGRQHRRDRKQHK
jgi:hypothetical protein